MYGRGKQWLQKVIFSDRAICFFPVSCDNVLIDGLSGDHDRVGKELDLTCTVSRIKPEAMEMYWTIRGNRVDGFPSVVVANGDGTHKQTITTKLT